MERPGRRIGPVSLIGGETTRMRVGRVAAPVLSMPGRALIALDAAQRREPMTTAPPLSAREAGQVLTTIAHFRGSPDPIGPLDTTPGPTGAERLRHVLACLRSVLELDAERTIVAITTNEPQAVAADLAENAAELPAGTTVKMLTSPDGLLTCADEARAVLVTGWKPTGLAHRHPHYLTWSHKPLLCSALQDPGFSHFLYLEDDLCFTEESWRYWRDYREPLARYGLLPGFVRVESLHGSLYVVDQSGSTDATRLPSVTLPGHEATDRSQLTFVNLPNAYQGMYVLDRPLAVDHCRRSAARDPWRSRALVDWAIRERAAIGPILDDVPAGFHSRNVVPVQVALDGSGRLDSRCALVHLPGNYTRGAHPDFGVIRVVDMFGDSA